MNDTLPKLNQKDADNKALVGICLLYFLENDPYIKELKSDWIQEWAKQGLLKSFSHVFFNTEPETETLVPWFMDRVFMDLAINKNSDEQQMKAYINKIKEYDGQMLEKMYQISEKYNLDTNISPDKYLQSITNSIANKEDLADYMFSFFADALLHSEIIILNYFYNDWFEIKEPKNL